MHGLNAVARHAEVAVGDMEQAGVRCAVVRERQRRERGRAFGQHDARARIELQLALQRALAPDGLAVDEERAVREDGRGTHAQDGGNDYPSAPAVHARAS